MCLAGVTKMDFFPISSQILMFSDVGFAPFPSAVSMP